MALGGPQQRPAPRHHAYHHSSTALGVELVRQRVRGKPLLDAELDPGAGLVQPDNNDLDELAVPAMVRA